ncbi:hypothetical protein QTN47_15200 [Danxiaibacter flavus]|uniref:Glycosyl-4,4'-diaponeurosporenoate acyltransferase n=1 Tax=Danxiaibacter flavus TaxID=3049108 RepID=A0ABV3ZGA5_9BACT|nr:hypothetical protein QNM32_15210 [Chitinophagaceae bacterium DXS]
MSDKRKNIETVIGLYNMIPNVVWSVINFTPVYFFYALPGNLHYLWIVIAISLVGFFLPKSFYSRLQLSNSIRTYNKLGIRIVRKYAQDGDLINRLIRKKYPGYKPHIQPNFRKHIGKTYFYEKFHFVCLLFFLLTTVLAFMQEKIILGSLITIANILYNVYPILLQQYNRLRIMLLLKHTRRLAPDE